MMVSVLPNLLAIFALFVSYCCKSHQLPLSYSTGHFGIGQSLDRSGEVSDFLIKFGYIPKDDTRVAAFRSTLYLSDAIKRMQQFAGIPVTGIVDEETINLTKRPRCGLPDFYPSDFRSRVKRYSLEGSKWDKLTLTWRLNGSLPGTINRNTMEREMGEALQLWSYQSKLTFQRANAASADIVISFFRGYHGDHMAFDGKNDTLAHAFYPGPDLGGDVHFDADEKWIHKGVVDPSGVNLYSAAAHEFGHSLGLAHSSVKDALMFPYAKKDLDVTLHQDDINGIQALYGPRDGYIWPEPRPTRTPRPTRSTQPSTTKPAIPLICSTGFDAISVLREEIYFFKDTYFWRLRNGRQLEREDAVSIHIFWHNLPRNIVKIDAVYERPLDGKFTFFIGDQYWIINNNDPEMGYPKSIHTLGLPANIKSIDAATTWGYNNLVYFFSGDQYWRFDEKANKVELDYPRGMKVWKGVPAHLDAAFHLHKNGKTYFVKGRGLWQFDDQTMSVIPASPQSTTHFWFDICSNEEYPDLNIEAATEPSTRKANGSASSTILITFSYFASIFIMLSLLFVFNQSVNIS